MFSHLGAEFDHRTAQFVALLTLAVPRAILREQDDRQPVMANRLDAQEVAQSLRSVMLLRR
ncbi:hypothetical protein [Pseudomonas fluorescens]|uniref:hypothetical protein n=1 Tax=Pseudomonas fluorescens TaxID=294 RepID=UPI00123F347B|nr:hypothetical protein [Pseudomonas fluorescens]